ncbi:MAG: hypothetical protein QW404_02425 [Candidatus Nanoarchaeia archaeon]
MEEKTYLAVKVGICDDLEEKLLRYSKEFKIWPEGDPTVKKFFMRGKINGEEVYTMISDTEGGIVSETDYYNITVTVWGKDREKVIEKMSELEKNIGIKFKIPPDTLLLKYRLLGFKPDYSN